MTCVIILFRGKLPFSQYQSKRCWYITVDPTTVASGNSGCTQQSISEETRELTQIPSLGAFVSVTTSIDIVTAAHGIPYEEVCSF